MNSLFAEYFVSHVKKNPNQVALKISRNQVTYSDLDRWTNCLAYRLLHKLCIGKNDVVCIMMPRMKELMTAVVGTLKAGAAYLPTHGKYSTEQIQFMLRDADAKAVITTREMWMAKNIEFDQNRVVFLDDIGLFPESAGRVIVENADSDAVAIQYAFDSAEGPKRSICTYGSMEKTFDLNEHFLINSKDAFEHFWLNIGTGRSGAKRYFENLMRGAFSVEYPKSDEQNSQHDANSISVEIPAEKKVEMFLATERLTPEVYFMTSLLCVLQRVMRQDDLMIFCEVPTMVRLDSLAKKSLLLPVVLSKCTLELSLKEAVLECQRQVLKTLEYKEYLHGAFAENFLKKAHVKYAFGGASQNSLECVESSAETENRFPLLFNVFYRDGVYCLNIEYDNRCYSRHDMQQLLDAWYMLSVEGVSSKCPVSRLPLVTETSAEYLLCLGNGDQQNGKDDVRKYHDESENIISYFVQNTSRNPDKPILYDENGFYTNAELDRLSNQVANWIVSEGILQASAIGIHTPRCKEYMAIALGILKAGCCFVTLDMDIPEDRRISIEQDAKISVVIDLEMFYSVIAHGDSSPINLNRNDAVFQIFFTSGTTGKPKGVVTLMSQLPAIINRGLYVGVSDFEGVHGVMVRFSFVACMGNLWNGVMHGDTTHIISEKLFSDPAKMAEYITRNKITYMLMPASYGISLINNFDMTLKHVFLVAEKPLPIKTDKIVVLNFYASTESWYSSSQRLTRDTKRLTAGHPPYGTYLYILDENGQLLPQGVAGEICVTSPFVAKGYLNNPELNAKKFVPNPFMPGKVMFRTGDLGKWDADGNLVVLGRTDNMVKVRGFRVELDEIGNVGMSCDCIERCVCAKVNAGGSETLCCYYTVNAHEGCADADSADAEIKLKAIFKQKLPSYMQPSCYVRLSKIPLNANGKVNRRALPEPKFVAEEMILPATRTERQLYDVVSDMLCEVSFGVTTNLVSVGMTSITAMRIAMRIQQVLNVQVRMADLMKKPSVRELAAMIDASEECLNSHFGKVQPIQKYYPITANQMGVYLDWEMHRESLQYNIPIAMKLKNVDAEKLADAIRKVVKAHPVFNVKFANVNGEVMLLRNDVADAMVRIDRVNVAPDLQSRVLPFDLFVDNLYRFEIYVCSDESLYLFCDIHHIVSDGLSQGMLLKEIFATYGGENIDCEDYTFFDYALESKKYVASESFQQDKLYFQNLLQGLESTVYPHSQNVAGAGKCRQVSLNCPKKNVESACTKLGVTSNSYLLCVLMEVVRRMTREERVLLTSISNGRGYGCLQKLQGFFVKTLPVVGEDSPQALQRQLVESFCHEEYPLTEMVESMGVRPEIMYAFEGQLLNGTLDVDFEMMPLSLDTTKAPLTILVNPDLQNEFIITAEYDDGLYNEIDMLTMLRCVVTLAENFSKKPNSKISECSMLTVEEECNLVALGTGEKIEYDKEKNFVDLFKAQVCKTPNAVAVVDKNGFFTYKELDEASTEYSKYVEPETFVCLEMPRVKEFVVAALGVWKAHSAYVPIDMEYPEERKSFMRSECDGRKLPNPNIAYMIYTSGSTGKPKGVMVPHSSLAAFVSWRKNVLNLNESSRHAQYVSFAFDASFDDLFCPLIAGGQVHILDEETRMDTARVYRYFKEFQIKSVAMPTRLGVMLLEQFTDMQLDYLMVGGERLDYCPKTSTKVVNEYGPTEFTVCSSYHVVDASRETQIPIGRPVPNSVSFICDRNNRLLPQGCVGELCLAGPQLTLGYWNKPELTVEKFVKVSFAGNLFEIYKTGDLCRWNENGELEYIGRIDNQVKLRGFRVELGEVENLALQHGGIKQAVALVKNDQIVLYYCAYQSFESESLRLFFAERLPEYMVPSIFTFLSEMPLTPNGKINRKALPEPKLVVEEYVPPQNESEKVLCKFFADTFGVERFGVTDSLKAYGMTSIAAMQMMLKLSHLGFDISLNALSKADCVKKICETVESKSQPCRAGFWLNAYDNEKPTMVLVCGVTGESKIIEHVASWKECCNIYVLRPLFDVWSNLEQLDYERILEFYENELSQEISGNVSCFFGFSFGGELAYCLAERWNRRFNELPLVFLGDSIADKSAFENVKNEYENANEEFYLQMQRQFFGRLGMLPFKPYAGNVVLCSAVGGAVPRNANEVFWKNLAKNVKIYHVEDTHEGLYEHGEHYSMYLKLMMTQLL